MAAPSRFAKAGVELEDSCATTVSECEKCGAPLKKRNPGCGCGTDMVCPKCGHCNYCHGTKRCQEQCCKDSSPSPEKSLHTKCKVCMDTGECQQCLYR